MPDNTWWGYPVCAAVGVAIGAFFRWLTERHRIVQEENREANSFEDVKKLRLEIATLQLEVRDLFRHEVDCRVESAALRVELAHTRIELADLKAILNRSPFLMNGTVKAEQEPAT